MGWKSLFLSLSMAVIVPATLAQTPALTAQNDTTQARPADGQNDDEILTTIRTQVQEVNVIFTATDRKGRYLKDLKSADLAVLDDGKPPARMNSFVSETDLPLRVGLVMDVSGSITDRMTFDVTSLAPLAVNKTRTYRRFSDAQADMVVARIYAGIHFRTADEVARTQGMQVADWVFDHAFGRRR